MPSVHPRDTDPITWLKAENMMLGVCLKAMLAKLDPEVKREVLAALTAVLDLPDSPQAALLKVVCADLTSRLDSVPPEASK